MTDAVSPAATPPQTFLPSHSPADKDVSQNFTCRHGTSATPHHVSSRHASRVSLPSRTYHRLLDVATRCCMRGHYTERGLSSLSAVSPPSAATWITSARTINRLTVHHRHHHRGQTTRWSEFPLSSASQICLVLSSEPLRDQCSMDQRRLQLSLSECGEDVPEDASSVLASCDDCTKGSGMVV